VPASAPAVAVQWSRGRLRTDNGRSAQARLASGDGELQAVTSPTIPVQILSSSAARLACQACAAATASAEGHSKVRATHTVGRRRMELQVVSISPPAMTL
jgi:hypothetical protein